MSVLIGTIVRHLERALPIDTPDGPTPEDTQQIMSAYEDYDRRYANRADYKLWRCALEPYFARNKPWLGGWQTSISAQWVDWSSLARSGLNSNDNSVFWSTVALAPELIARIARDGDTGDGAPIWPIVHQMYSKLEYEAEPLSACPASCGVAATLFLVRYQYLHHRAGKKLSEDSVARIVASIERWLCVTDPQWRPGFRLDASGLQDERKSKAGRLRPGHDAHEFTTFVNSMRAVRPFISLNTSTLNAEGARLQRVAADFAHTAWLTARSVRLDELRHQEYMQARRGWDPSRARKKRRTAVLSEFSCLNNLVLATRDSARSQSDYLNFARFAYLMLRFIPDEFVQDPKILPELKGRRSMMFRYIKEAGLEVDPRFTKDQLSTPEQTNSFPVNDEIDTIDDKMPRLTSVISQSGYGLVVEADQERMEEWQTVKSEIPKGARETAPGYLLTVVKRVADSGAHASEGTLRAIFHLSLHYGFIRSAGKILHRAVSGDDFPLTKEDVLDFVHSMRRTMSLDPFGMRNKWISAWQSLVRDACDKLWTQRATTGEWFRNDELLWVHETLMGRTHTHQRTLSYEAATRLYGKATGVFEFGDMREFYDRDYAFWRRPMGVATSNTLGRFSQSYAGSSRGAPVMASILCFGRFVSVVAVGRDERICAREVSLEGRSVEGDVEELQKGSEFWFRSPALAFDEQIGSTAMLDELVGALLGICQDCDAGARSILLAAEPILAQLPWQYLVGVNLSAGATTESEQGRKAWLVSLVPNLSTITIGRQTDDLNSGLKLMVASERDSALETIGKVISETTRDREEKCDSLCIIAGHGKSTRDQADSKVTSVSLGNERALDSIGAWMEVLRAKHIVLHCCHAGGVAPILMRELGGVPGIGLALGAEVFIAPVTEVSASVAAVLQEELFEGEGDRDVAESYLSAIDRNPAVVLYNIYGNPYERLFVA